jgi:hypothetical protein
LLRVIEATSNIAVAGDNACAGDVGCGEGACACRWNEAAASAQRAKAATANRIDRGDGRRVSGSRIFI